MKIILSYQDDWDSKLYNLTMKLDTFNFWNVSQYYRFQRKSKDRIEENSERGVGEGLGKGAQGNRGQI